MERILSVRPRIRRFHLAAESGYVDGHRPDNQRHVVVLSSGDDRTDILRKDPAIHIGAPSTLGRTQNLLRCFLTERRDRRRLQPSPERYAALFGLRQAGGVR